MVSSVWACVQMLLAASFVFSSELADSTTSLLSNQVLLDIGDVDTNTSMAVQVHHSASGRRRRRDIYHLYKFMTCTSPCDPLSYTNYGCYCGFLGSGDVVDGLDRCCMIHDYCYGDTRCRMQKLIYFIPYKWKCNGGYPYCVPNYSEDGGYKRPMDECAHHLCECDREFAECISQYPCPNKKQKAKCTSNPLRNLRLG